MKTKIRNNMFPMETEVLSSIKTNQNFQWKVRSIYIKRNLRSFKNERISLHK